MNIFATSDHHFFHQNIIKFCNRPYNDVDEMNASIIKIWNRYIKPGDVVFHLGDFSFSKNYDDNLRIFNDLNGEKHLIRGNHDKHVENLPWASKQDYLEYRYNGNTFVMFHYPIVEWSHYYRGSYHLYGHVHGTGFAPKNNRSMDVGWDTSQKPFNLNEIVEKLEKNQNLRLKPSA